MRTFKKHFGNVTGTRIKKIRVRIRAGKVQRNIRKSGLKGYSLRGGKLVRMTAAERLHRRRGARRAKFKRKARMARTLMRRRRSLKRRRNLGT